VLRCLVVARPGHQGHNDTPLPDSAPTTVELQRLVSCCPNLQECKLRVCDDIELSPLAALTGLTRLSLATPTWPTFQSLSELQRLKQLFIDVRSELRPWVLDGLTALQDLQILQVSGTPDYGEEAYTTFNFAFYNHGVSDSTVATAPSCLLC
jgi:hypothetical protein